MKRIISMAVVLVITMAAMAQKGELAMNENISGKDHISKNEKRRACRRRCAFYNSVCCKLRHCIFVS